MVSNSKYNFSKFDNTESFVHQFLSHNISSYLASKIGPRCLSYNVVAACATGLLSVIKGVELLNRNIVDLVIAGSIETSKIPLIEAAFGNMGVLSKQNKTKPFSKERDGFVIGEGGAILVLKRASDHDNPKTPWISGYAYANDASDIVAINSDAKSIKHVIQKSILMANIKTVDYINAHGTGTSLNDEIELKGILASFPDTSNIYLNSTKNFTGHVLGGTGSIELALSLLSMTHQKYIPSTYLKNPMEAMEKFSMTGNPTLSSMLSLNYGFGGHIAAAVIQNGETGD